MDLVELIQKRERGQTNNKTTMAQDILSALITLSFFWLMLIFILATAKK